MPPVASSGASSESAKARPATGSTTPMRPPLPTASCQTTPSPRDAARARRASPQAAATVGRAGPGLSRPRPARARAAATGSRSPPVSGTTSTSSSADHGRHPVARVPPRAASTGPPRPRRRGHGPREGPTTRIQPQPSSSSGRWPASAPPHRRASAAPGRVGPPRRPRPRARRRGRAGRPRPPPATGPCGRSGPRPPDREEAAHRPSRAERVEGDTFGADVERRRAEQPACAQDLHLGAQLVAVRRRGLGLAVSDPPGRVEDEHPGAETPCQPRRDRRQRVRAERRSRQVTLGLEGPRRGLVLLGRHHRRHGLGDRDERRRLRHLEDDEPAPRSAASSSAGGTVAWVSPTPRPYAATPASTSRST